MRDAFPENFKVDKIGGLPATGQYFVLDLVHDFEARVALAKLGTNYERIGQPVRAQEARRALDASVDAHAAAMEARNPKSKKKASGKVEQGR